MAVDHAAEAARIVAAHDRHALLDPITDRSPITMADAYAIQDGVTAARLARGACRIGWKLGYTSQAMRRQMNIDAPNFGPLTDAMLLDDGGNVGGHFTQPRVEPEVLLRFGSDVAPGADRATVLAAVASGHAALEVVDSVWREYRFRIEDNTADGSSAAGVVIGPALPLASIVDVGVELMVDGSVVARGVGSDASGHPADGVVWLVNELADRGHALRAGDIVLTGGLTPAAALGPGTVATARFGNDLSVTIRTAAT